MSSPDNRARAEGTRPESGPGDPAVRIHEREIYRLMVESVRDYAIYLLDPEGRITSWNKGAERIKGYRADEVIGKHYGMFYPAKEREAGTPERQLEEAARQGRVESEGWRVRKDGSRLWAHVVLTALYDGGRLVGYGKVTGDLTAERAARQELARRERQLEEAQAIAHLGSWAVDPDAGLVSTSREMRRIMGLDDGAELDYTAFLERVHAEDRSAVDAVIREAMDAESPFVVEHRIARPDGGVRWVQSRGAMSGDDGVPRLVGTTLDITELKESESRARELAGEQAAREEAERTAQRMGFLAEASALLSASMNYRDTLETVAWLAVPPFADWAAVDMVDPDGEIRRIAVAHMDPEQVARAKDLHEQYPPALDDPTGVAAVIRTGEPELYEELSAEEVAAAAEDEEHARILEELGLRSALVVPIRVRDRTLGAITFIYAESGRLYTRDDLLVARELAERAGLAIENSQLHDAERTAREHAERAESRTRRLQTITAELSEAVTPEAVARIMVDHGAEALGAASGSLVLVRGDNTLEMVRTTGIPESVVRRYERFDTSAEIPLAESIRTGELVMVRNVEEREARYPAISNVRAETKTEAMVVVPLRAGAGVIGSLGFGYSGPRSFDQDDREFLRALGRQCAQALERAWLYETEHLAREAAEAASQAKSQFVAMVSHELRTPLSAIIGYQELLAEEIAGPVTEKQREQLSRIRSAATHLRDLINQILSLSRIEAGKEEVEWSEVDVEALVAEVATLMQQEAKGRGLTLRTTLDVASPLLETDVGKVRQILLNLLSNAMKFTPEGTVEVGARDARGSSYVELYVRDTGVGISPEDQERVFEAFTQVDQSMTRSVGGSGLGLAVSRRLASLLGGTLELDSEPGRGSTFKLRLPRSRSE